MESSPQDSASEASRSGSEPATSASLETPHLTPARTVSSSGSSGPCCGKGPWMVTLLTLTLLVFLSVRKTVAFLYYESGTKFQQPLIDEEVSPIFYTSRSELVFLD